MSTLMFHQKDIGDCNCPEHPHWGINDHIPVQSFDSGIFTLSLGAARIRPNLREFGRTRAIRTDTHRFVQIRTEPSSQRRVSKFDSGFFTLSLGASRIRPNLRAFGQTCANLAELAQFAQTRTDSSRYAQSIRVSAG